MAYLPTINELTSDIQGGGGIVNSMKGINALTESSLNNRKKELENQYYGPNIESEIANRNALTTGYQIANKYAPDRLRLANEYAEQINPLKIRKQQLENDYAEETNPLNKTKLQIEVANLDAKIKAQIKAQEAMANWKNTGGSAAGVDQKAAQGFIEQLHIDHPEWTTEQLNDAANAYYDERHTFSNGEPLPTLLGQAADKLTKIKGKNAPAAIQNQAANMDVLSADINDIDIMPITKFTGRRGKVEYAKNMANMATGGVVSKDFREYLAFKDVTSQFAMDALRKGFGTSVVPGYVYATLGKAANPASSWWNDPEQILLEWKKTKEWVENNAARLKIKANKGVTANVSKTFGNNKPSDLSQLSDAELLRIVNGK